MLLPLFLAGILTAAGGADNQRRRRHRRSRNDSHKYQRILRHALGHHAQCKAYTLDGKTAYQNVTLEAGKEYSAEAVIHDFEDDPISYRWEVLPESTDLQDGGDYEERPQAVEGLFVSEEGGKLTLRAPAPGPYRLFVYAGDGHGHAATANIPFLVE